MAFERFKDFFSRAEPEIEPERELEPDIRERQYAFSTGPAPLTLGKALEIELARPKFTAVVNVVTSALFIV